MSDNVMKMSAADHIRHAKAWLGRAAGQKAEAVSGIGAMATAHATIASAMIAQERQRQGIRFETD